MIKLFILGSFFSFSDTSQIASQTNITVLNQYHSQYFPQYDKSRNEIYFTVRKNKGDHEDLYVSKLVQGSALQAEALEKINTNFFNEGTCSFSEDGQTMVFSACDYPNSKGGCDLYESTWENNQWTTAKNLGFFINSREWDGQPHLSNQGQTIYFSSERAGGMGGRDIWMSEKDKNGVWGIPQNLGANINSNANEIGPYFIADRSILVFSSDRKEGKGKLDFYQSLFENKKWQVAKNLIILNSKEDNAGICEGQYCNEFFLTESNSNKIPAEKIYSVLLPDSIWLKPSPPIVNIENPTPSIRFSELHFSDIHFENNKWDLPYLIPNSLILLLKFLQENPIVQIKIEGHSDETGNAKSNITLSEKRALSVKNFLIQKGIQANRITTKGFGHLKPKTKDLAGNRRIEVKQL